MEEISDVTLRVRTSMSSQTTCAKVRSKYIGRVAAVFLVVEPPNKVAILLMYRSLSLHGASLT